MSSHDTRRGEKSPHEYEFRRWHGKWQRRIVGERKWTTLDIQRTKTESTWSWQ